MTRKTVSTTVAVACLALASISNLYATTLAGVTLPDTVQAAGTTLTLNGLGVRTKFVVKVYVAGLYLDRKSSDPEAIMKFDAPKRIVMQFVHGASKNQMSDAFYDAFKDNTPDAITTMKVEIDRLLAAIEPVKDGDQMVFTYIPGAGTTFAVNGKDKLTIASAAFSHTLFSVWLGPKPPNASLKKGLLGQ